MNLSDIEVYLDSVTLPSLTNEDCPALDLMISKEELLLTFTQLKKWNAPGPDGLTVEFLLSSQELFLDPLLYAAQEILVGRASLPGLNDLLIYLILKEGKHPLNSDAYRPIALLNQDYKIMANILATRLAPLLPGVIHSDQQGFVEGRSTFKALSWVTKIIYDRDQIYQQEAFISFDFHKAFDSLKWEYLWAVLARMGIGTCFIQMIQSLYRSATARVRTDNILSVSLKLERGSRQGFPLSPLSFALAIEPLAEQLRMDISILGTYYNGRANKVSLFADLLVFSCIIDHDMPRQIETIDAFGKLSGLRLNGDKTRIMIFPQAKHTLILIFISVIRRNWNTVSGYDFYSHPEGSL